MLLIQPEIYYEANPGDKLKSKSTLVITTYVPDIDSKYIYTYDYAPEQIWLKESGKLTLQGDYEFTAKTYFRTEKEVEFVRGIFGLQPQKWLVDEALRVTDEVNRVREDGDYTFVLMTDSHYNVGGTWNDTVAGVKVVCDMISLDGIIHLGDFTDGMVSKAATTYYAEKVMADLRSIAPVYAAIGNHDTNYFRNNPERLSITEQCKVYLDGNDLRYYIDKLGVRLIFLDSFDPDEALRYGYSDEGAAWLDDVLSTADKAVIFSHLPPTTRLQFWAEEIRDKAVKSVVAQHADKILAWINGHNHIDSIDNEEGIPSISINNAKCEAFSKMKPDWGATPPRKLNDASQECWDVLLLNPQKGKLHFIRFGAGNDRIIENGKANWR